jgi:tRNA(Ile)-lysidine synthase TilS/MesJ
MHRTDTTQIRVIEGEIEEYCTRCGIPFRATPTPPIALDDGRYHVVCAAAEHLDRTTPALVF